MTCEIIATGSKGNAVLLNGKYLFDCGVPYEKLKPYAGDITAVFLTHIHADHFKKSTIRKLFGNRPSVRFVCDLNMLVPLACDCKVDPDNIVLVTPEAPGEIHLPGETIRIQTFDLVHNVENVGYRVEVTGGENPGSALYATDTQYIPVSAPGLDLYMVECNYRDAAELEARKARKAQEGRFIYEDTVAAVHMSQQTIESWLALNAGPGSEVVYLHQHIEREAEPIG